MSALKITIGGVSMLQVFQVCIDILFFRRGPDALPPSLPLFLMVLTLDFVLTLLVLAAIGAESMLPLATYIVGLIMQISIVWLLLNVLQLEDRFLQTVTAILGADVFLTLAQLLLVSIAGDLSGVTDVSERPLTLSLLGMINLWYLALEAFIVKRAANLKWLAAIGVVFSIYVLTHGAVDFMFD